MNVGVFFVFAPVGILIGMIQPQPVGWLVGCLLGGFAGVMALGWSYTVSRRRWWLLIPLNLAPFFVPRWIFGTMSGAGLLSPGYGMEPFWRMVVLTVMIGVSLSIGFVCVIHYIRESERANVRVYAELAVAGQVHETLVPAVAFRERGLEVDGVSHASSEMGGDLIDLVRRGSEVDVYLADVSGHGVGAGIVMAMVKSAIRMRLRVGGTLPEVLRDVNATMAELTDSGTFATLACLRVACGDGPRRVEYALAGHLPILWRSGSGEVRELANESLPLGVDSEESFVGGGLEASPGDTFLLVTDGITESRSAAGVMLGMDAVRRVFAERGGEDLGAVRAAVLEAADAQGPQNDDRTVVLLRIS